MKKIFFLLAFFYFGVCFCHLEDYKNKMIKGSQSVPGWCSREKSEAMMDLIFETRPSLCVEIGVYAGRSLLPTAAALAYNKHGVVIGIDPWALEECIKNYPEDPVVVSMWENQDLEKLYHRCINQVETMGLQDYAIILRQTSREAAAGINEIDILHIDGNHSEQSVLIDVRAYLGKVRVGGYIWLDDVLRATTVGPYSFVRRRGELIKSVDKGNCELWKKIR